MSFAGTGIYHHPFVSRTPPEASNGNTLQDQVEYDQEIQTPASRNSALLTTRTCHGVVDCFNETAEEELASLISWQSEHCMFKTNSTSPKHSRLAFDSMDVPTSCESLGPAALPSSGFQGPSLRSTLAHLKVPVHHLLADAHRHGLPQKPPQVAQPPLFHWQNCQYDDAAASKKSPHENTWIWCHLRKSPAQNLSKPWTC